jgi:hypothetical protein
MNKHEHKPTPGNAEVCLDCEFLAYGPMHKLDSDGSLEWYETMILAEHLKVKDATQRRCFGAISPAPTMPHSASDPLSAERSSPNPSEK